MALIGQIIIGVWIGGLLVIGTVVAAEEVKNKIKEARRSRVLSQ